MPTSPSRFDRVIAPPFRPYDQVRVVEVAGWMQRGLVGKTGTVLDAPALPNNDRNVPGAIWLQVHIHNGQTLPLLDTEIELLPKGPSAIALDLCHR